MLTEIGQILIAITLVFNTFTVRKIIREQDKTWECLMLICKDFSSHKAHAEMLERRINQLESLMLPQMEASHVPIQ